MATTLQVILNSDVPNLGSSGELVKVRPGYARNFLLPQGKALRANDANVAKFADQKAVLETRNLESKKEAEAAAVKLDGQKFVLIRSASDSGALYGSVTPRDASEAAELAGFSVDRRQVVLTRPIKELGLHTLSVMLHPEVTAMITLNVARSEDEARIQAEGKSIQQLAAEADAAAEFEIAELFDDMGAAMSDDDTGPVKTPENN